MRRPYSSLKLVRIPRDPEGFRTQCVNGGGFGVIATREFKEGDFLLVCRGLRVTKEKAEELKKVYKERGTPPCFYTHSSDGQDICIDSTETEDCLASSVTEGSWLQVNTRVRPISVDSQLHLCLFAEKMIKADQEIKRKKKSSGIHPAAIAAGVGGVVMGLGAVVAAPFVLTAVGFTGGGIAAGSFAASMMSSAAVANGGGVAAGSLVAVLQSAGAVGISGGASALIGTSAGAAGAGLTGGLAALALRDKEKKNAENEDVDSNSDSADEKPGECATKEIRDGSSHVGELKSEERSDEAGMMSDSGSANPGPHTHANSDSTDSVSGGSVDRGSHLTSISDLDSAGVNAEGNMVSVASEDPSSDCDSVHVITKRITDEDKSGDVQSDCDHGDTQADAKDGDSAAVNAEGDILVSVSSEDPDSDSVYVITKRITDEEESREIRSDCDHGDI